MLHIPLPDHLKSRYDKVEKSATDDDGSVVKLINGVYPTLDRSSTTTTTTTVSRKRWGNTDIYLKAIPVTSSDSVVSVAVRNGISVEVLRQFNPSLIFDYCDFHEVVWVPDSSTNSPPVPVTRDEVAEEFRRQTKCTNEEASFYLHEAQHDLEKALEAWRADEEFEKTHTKYD